MTLLARSLRTANLSGFGVFGVDRFDGTDGASAPPVGQGIGWSTWAGVPVDERRALQHVTWWSCISLIADSVMQLPAAAFRDSAGSRLGVPDPQILKEPYPGIAWREWIGMQTVSAVGRGNAYALVTQRDRFENPTQLMPLHPDEVVVSAINGTPRYDVMGYGGGLTRHDVWHVKGMTLPGHYSFAGLDPVAYVRQTIGRGLGASEFAARWFNESANPGGLLSTDQTIDQDTADEMLERWEEAHGNRRRHPAILGGNLKWQSIEIKPEESQFLETIKATRTEIAGFMRCPPHLVGLGDMQSNWGTGVEENALQYVTFTLQPWLTRFEDALSAILPSPQYVKFNTAAFLRSRTLDRYRAYLMARQGGWANADEIRAWEDLPPVPDGKGQDFLQPLNYAPVPPGGGDPADLAADQPALAAAADQAG